MYYKAAQSQQENTKKAYNIGLKPVRRYKTGVKATSPVVEYRFSLSKYHRSIFDYIYSFKKRQVVCLKNTTIASQVGCSVRTVIRATNKFHEDTIIKKSQTHTYGVNIYAIHSDIKRGTHAFQLWVSSLSDSNKEMIMRHGAYRNLEGDIVVLGSKNVILTKKGLNNKYIYNKDDDGYRDTYSKKDAREVRVTESQSESSPFTDEHFNAFIKESEERESMLSEAGRNWVKNNPNNPRTKEYLDRPDIRPHVFTPLMEDIKQTLKLDDRQSLKLCAYPDQALSHTLQITKNIISGKMPLKNPISDGFDWFCAVTMNYLKKNDLRADMPYYRSLCTVLGIEEVYAGYNPQPLVRKSIARNPQGHSPMVHEVEMSDNDRIAFLVKEIALFKDKMNNPQRYFLPNVDIEAALQVGKTLLASRELELEQLTNPVDITPVDDDASTLSPTEWLIRNRERKRKQLKDKHAQYASPQTLTNL